MKKQPVAILSAVRSVERAMGDGRKKVYESEQPIIAKLRRISQEK